MIRYRSKASLRSSYRGLFTELAGSGNAYVRAARVQAARREPCAVSDAPMGGIPRQL